ncbi:hypothetical protein HID58_029655, partial [Brassica napus]
MIKKIWFNSSWPSFYCLVQSTTYLVTKVLLKRMAYRSSRKDKGKWIPDPPREARRPPIKIPQGDTASLIEEHKLTLIGRVTNPKIQKTRALLDISVAGEIKQVELEYDNLGKHCFLCFSLSHEKEDCPSQRALANNRGHENYRMGISQTRTLDRLDADKRKAFERKQIRSEAPQWQSSRSRDIEWKEDKNFRYNYGARRDPNFSTGSKRTYKAEEENRRPARERLSFTKEDTSSGRNEPLSRAASLNPRTEWRPVASGSQRGISKSVQSLVSHTPSPRPQREGGSSIQEFSQTRRQISGDGSQLSNERRSALERLSLPAERVPLLHGGVANAESGRLQEVDIQYLEELVPIERGNSVPSSSRNPGRNSLNLVGGTNVSSTSRNLGMSNENLYDATQERSPIRTLSEDRVHVSLRLGPLFDSEEEVSLNLPIEASKSKKGKAPATTKGQAVRSSGPSSPASRKRGPKSLVLGPVIKRRRVVKVQNSPKRRITKAAGTSDTRIEFNDKKFFV